MDARRVTGLLLKYFGDYSVFLTEDTMAQVDWYIEGVEFSNCNCDYACPCQFESRSPTHGDCRGFAAVRIDKGHFGDVALDGLGSPPLRLAGTDL